MPSGMWRSLDQKNSPRDLARDLRNFLGKRLCRATDGAVFHLKGNAAFERALKAPVLLSGSKAIPKLQITHRLVQEVEAYNLIQPMKTNTLLLFFDGSEKFSVQF